MGPERIVREQSCLQALQKLGENALACGRYEVAAGYYQRVVVTDAWSEGARRGWMEALAKSGDRNAALQVYREYVQLLRSDPTAIPDEQTRALYQRLRKQARLQADTFGTALTAGGEAVPVPRVTGYLPHALTDLVGREDERLEVTARLRRARLVTLIGPGGIGKTRLALEIASESVAEYADGVWLVALEALTEGKLVAQQIASVLGLREDQKLTALQSVTEHLRFRRMLLVLDNCEHLLEASAHVVSHLLQECAHVRILATSRAALGITGETAWAVPALAVPDPAHLPQTNATLLRVLMSYESVQLFVERAQALQKTFVLTGQNAPAVAQICARLEGIPLALELAAARVKVLSVEQIAARLDNELGLLTDGSRTAQSRQQTLRATLDWSYALLSERERLLLHRLAVFAGGWTLEAAETVCVGAGIEPWQLLNLLASLVDKSLIAFEARDKEIGKRYRMLEIVRQYAVEKIQMAGEDEECRERHLNWFLTLAEEARAHMNGSKQRYWLRRMETEYDNLRAALLWSETRTQDAEYGLRLTGALWWFWKIQGRYTEGQQYLRAALVREGATEETLFRARALKGAGCLAINQGDYIVTQACFEEMFAINRKLGNKRSIASALNDLGTLATAHNDCAGAFSLYQQSLSLFRELDDKQGIAMTLGNLGNILRRQRDYATAQSLLEESLKIGREVGDEHGLSRVLGSLGDLTCQQGDYVTAQAYLEESLDIRHRLGDRSGIAATQGFLGLLADAQGDYAMARALLEESLSVRRELGKKRLVAWSLYKMGHVALHEERFSEVRALFDESYEIYRDLGHKEGMAWSLNHLGKISCQNGEYALAKRQYADSLIEFRELGDKEGIIEILLNLGMLLAAQTERKKAARLWGAAEALHENLERPLWPVDQQNYERKMEQARADLPAEVVGSVW